MGRGPGFGAKLTREAKVVLVNLACVATALWLGIFVVQLVLLAVGLWLDFLTTLDVLAAMFLNPMYPPPAS